MAILGLAIEIYIGMSVLSVSKMLQKVNETAINERGHSSRVLLHFQRM